MKGYYTKKLLKKEKFYQNLIYSYMDQILIDIDDCIYNQFHHEFNRQGEFVYRAIHTKKSPFDQYREIEMCVNDDGVFVNGEKHENFSERYLYALNAFKDKHYSQNNMQR
ncbi:MAG: hypothetical protein IJ371_06570 [Clostridia bacterium]|nr:hypothetical protein [Clostridia bacterium]